MQGEGDTENALAAHEFAAHLRERAKHVFYAGARCGAAAVAFLLCIGDALGDDTFALDVDAPAGLFQHRFPFGGGVAAIRIDIAAGVAAIKERVEYRGASHGGIGDDYFALQLVALVHTGV